MLRPTTKLPINEADEADEASTRWVPKAGASTEWTWLLTAQLQSSFGNYRITDIRYRIRPLPIELQDIYRAAHALLHVSGTKV